MIHQGTKFLYANPAVESMSGFSREELQGMDFWDIVHPDYQDLIRERGLDRFTASRRRGSMNSRS